MSHCQQLGAALATLHRAGADFGMRRNNDLSVAGWGQLLDTTRHQADEVKPGLATALDTEYRTLAAR